MGLSPLCLVPTRLLNPPRPLLSRLSNTYSDRNPRLEGQPAHLDKVPCHDPIRAVDAMGGRDNPVGPEQHAPTLHVPQSVTPP